MSKNRLYHIAYIYSVGFVYRQINKTRSYRQQAAHRHHNKSSRNATAVSFKASLGLIPYVYCHVKFAIFTTKVRSNSSYSTLANVVVQFSISSRYIWSPVHRVPQLWKVVENDCKVMSFSYLFAQIINQWFVMLWIADDCGLATTFATVADSMPIGYGFS